MSVLCLFYFYNIFQKIKYFYSAKIFDNKKGKGEEEKGRGEGREKEGKEKEEKNGEKRREGRSRRGKEMKRQERGRERGKERGWREQGKGESVGVWCSNAHSRIEQHKPKHWEIC